MSFYVHINVRPTCVIFVNLSWPSIYQDTTINYASGRIIATRNFPKPDFIGPFMESWRYMLSPILPGEWTWHCIYLIWLSPDLSTIFVFLFLRSILDRFHEQFLSNFISCLGGLYSHLCVTITILCYNNSSSVCVWHSSVCYVINWHMIGCREVYIVTRQILHVLVMIAITQISYQ